MRRVLMRILDMIVKRWKKKSQDQPTGVDLLALASVSPETAELLSDEELVRLEKLCHSSLGEEGEPHEMRLVVTAEGIKVK